MESIYFSSHVLSWPVALDKQRRSRHEARCSRVGAIELISPSNKDRPVERQAFAAKCASYLHEGISVVLIDIITNRRANLHNEILNLLEESDAARLPSEVELYAAAYRPMTL